MKNFPLFQITKSIVIMAILAGLFTSCTSLVFEKPLPANANVVQSLPEFLEGTFKNPETPEYFQIERISDTHGMIYSYYGIPQDSINKYLTEFDVNPAEIVRKGDTILVHSQDEPTVKVVFRDGLYFTEKEPKYEINLTKGYFISDFENLDKHPLILKSDNNGFYINMQADENWFVIRFTETQNGMQVLKTTLKHTKFSKTSPYVIAGIPVEKIGEDSYLADPTDEQFASLLEQPDLFEQANWVKIEKKKKCKFSFRTLLSILLGIMIFAYALYVLERKE